MIYLTNDQDEQAVYFELEKVEPRRVAGGLERRIYGLLGNGVTEIPVTIRSWRDCVDVAFGAGRLLEFVEERLMRRLLGELVREMALT